jgi:hypothetical protein
MHTISEVRNERKTISLVLPKARTLVNPLEAVTVREIAIFVFLQKIHASMAINRSFTAEPELMYLETAALKSTRPQVQGPRERVLVRGVEAAATLHHTQQDIVTLVPL